MEKTFNFKCMKLWIFFSSANAKSEPRTVYTDRREGAFSYLGTSEAREGAKGLCVCVCVCVCDVGKWKTRAEKRKTSPALPILDFLRFSCLFLPAVWSQPHAQRGVFFSVVFGEVV